MSFFQRMMKVTHNPKPKYSRQQEQIYNEQQTAPNQQYSTEPFHQKQKKLMKDFSLKQSLSIKGQQPQQDNGWEEILEQTSVNPVYITVKPVLMSHLLPKKQQLMRDMLAKKKQFQQRKKQINEQKAMHLEHIIQEQSYKFKASLSMVSKMNKMKESNVTDKNRSPVPRKLSQNKPKKPLTLEQSIYSASLHTQMMASPVAADVFNREIMLKLINIIQKQRQSTVVKSVAGQCSSELKSKQREGPIIINNIMKTPMENLSRDLIDRQLKIKMLQNTRFQKQFHKESSAKPLPKKSGERTSIIRENCSQFQNQLMILTDRSNKRVETAGFQLSADNCNKTTNNQSPEKSSKKSSISFQSSEQFVKRKLSGNNCVYKTVNKKLQKQIQGPQSTKYNSKNQSLVEQEVVYKMRDKKNQKIGKENSSLMKSKNQDKLKQKENFDNQKDKQITPSSKVQVQSLAICQEYKPPVLMEIPLENQSNLQGLTLAEAFKRKIGRLKSQQKIFKKQINKLVTPKARSPKIQQMPSQMTVTITDKLTECNSQFGQDPLLGTIKHSNFSQEQLASKRSALSKNKSKAESVYKGKGDMSSSKCIREPSKELVDRLIYGQKAKISKQEMYALTKKNYANLPQVQAKRKQEQKRKAQQDRLTKAREYQKAIRVGRSQK